MKLPYGYVLVNEEIAVYGKQADAVHNIFEYYLAGASLGKIVDMLHTKGIPSPSGKPLCKSAFKFYSYLYPGCNRPISNVIYSVGFDADRVDLKSQMLYLIRAA